MEKWYCGLPAGQGYRVLVLGHFASIQVPSVSKILCLVYALGPSEGL